VYHIEEENDVHPGLQWKSRLRLCSLVYSITTCVWQLLAIRNYYCKKNSPYQITKLWRHIDFSRWRPQSWKSTYPGFGFSDSARL